jgi:hypothetical protein
MSKVIAKCLPGIGLGNKMFINAFAYIISKVTGKEFVPIYIEYFKNTHTKHNNVFLENPLYTSKYGNNYVNLHELYQHTGDIVIDSYVQRQEYYTAYREELRDFFYEATCNEIQSSNTVLYIRNGDYRDIGEYLGLNNYIKFIDTVGCQNLTIVVEHIDNDVMELSKKYNATIYSESIFEDFIHIKNASIVLMSQSTFAWWAVFLGKADAIYFPFTQKNKMWKETPTQDDVDLFFNTTKSYKIIM